MKYFRSTLLQTSSRQALTGGWTDRDIAAGEEVLISYGELSAADLLTAYGFVEEPGTNPHDSLPLDLVRPL